MSYHDRCDLGGTLIRCNRSYGLHKFEYLFRTINDLHQLLHSRPAANYNIMREACRRKHEKKWVQQSAYKNVATV